ncbi:MAG TPA: hypothetical protein PLW66_08770, partial [Saprospiraceae bacterium]|nr:hypothetical protein [Saprospiraceae bacterium]
CLATRFMDAGRLARVRAFASPAPVREVRLATAKSYARTGVVTALKEEITALFGDLARPKNKGVPE